MEVRRTESSPSVRLPWAVVWTGNSFNRGELGTVDLLVLLIILTIVFTYFTKQAAISGRLIVLSLPLQLVFLGMGNMPGPLLQIFLCCK